MYKIYVLLLSNAISLTSWLTYVGVALSVAPNLHPFRAMYHP